MNRELKVQALLDGELPKREAALLHQQSASSPEDQKLIAELKSIKEALAPENEIQLKVPETREFYWSQIQRRIQQQENRRPAFQESFITRWRRFFVPLAGVAGATALLLLSVRQFVPNPAFDDSTVTSNEMESMTFHDATAGMTVVWLQEKDLPAPQVDEYND